MQDEQPNNQPLSHRQKQATHGKESSLGTEFRKSLEGTANADEEEYEPIYFGVNNF